MIHVNSTHLSFFAVFFAFALLAFGEESIAKDQGNPCNPCAANPCATKNPCAVSPCAGSNPCAANPCAAGTSIDLKLVTRPKGTMLAKGNPADLIKEGERLFKDESLSTNGTSCISCHLNLEMFMDTFAKPYPHGVEMAKESGMDQIDLDEMIQFCILTPMEAKPLPWDSRELAALTAYTAELQKSFVARGGAANPCAGKNPCAANPCAVKKNPCAQ